MFLGVFASSAMGCLGIGAVYYEILKLFRHSEENTLPSVRKLGLNHKT